MISRLLKFKNDEDGAVTVDWVVLTAGISLLGIAVVTSVLTASTDTSRGIGEKIVRDGTQLLNNGVPD